MQTLCMAAACPAAVAPPPPPPARPTPTRASARCTPFAAFPAPRHLATLRASSAAGSGSWRLQQLPWRHSLAPRASSASGSSGEAPGPAPLALSSSEHGRVISGSLDCFVCFHMFDQAQACLVSHPTPFLRPTKQVTRRQTQPPLPSAAPAAPAAATTAQPAARGRRPAAACRSTCSCRAAHCWCSSAATSATGAASGWSTPLPGRRAW